MKNLELYSMKVEKKKSAKGNDYYSAELYDKTHGQNLKNVFVSEDFYDLYGSQEYVLLNQDDFDLVPTLFEDKKYNKSVILYQIQYIGG